LVARARPPEARRKEAFERAYAAGFAARAGIRDLSGIEADQAAHGAALRPGAGRGDRPRRARLGDRCRLVLADEPADEAQASAGHVSARLRSGDGRPGDVRADKAAGDVELGHAIAQEPAAGAAADRDGHVCAGILDCARPAALSEHAVLTHQPAGDYPGQIHGLAIT